MTDAWLSPPSSGLFLPASVKALSRPNFSASCLLLATKSPRSSSSIFLLLRRSLALIMPFRSARVVVSPDKLEGFWFQPSWSNTSSTLEGQFIVSRIFCFVQMRAFANECCMWWSEEEGKARVKVDLGAVQHTAFWRSGLRERSIRGKVEY